MKFSTLFVKITFLENSTEDLVNMEPSSDIEKEVNKKKRFKIDLSSTSADADSIF